VESKIADVASLTGVEVGVMRKTPFFANFQPFCASEPVFRPFAGLQR
jgi:hypothetical protein